MNCQALLRATKILSKFFFFFFLIFCKHRSVNSFWNVKKCFALLVEHFASFNNCILACRFVCDTEIDGCCSKALELLLVIIAVVLTYILPTYYVAACRMHDLILGSATVYCTDKNDGGN